MNKPAKSHAREAINLNTNNTTKNKNKLRMSYINAENVKPKATEILQVIGGGGRIEKIDILGVGETWDDGTTTGNTSYTWFSQKIPHHNHKHKGVGAFVRKGLACFTSIMEKISDQRVMWLQILTKTEALYVAVVYCSPNSMEDLQSVLLNIETNQAELGKCGKVLVMGDFNGRLGNITGDDLINDRGKMIKKLSKKSGLQIIKSSQPVKYTFYHKFKGQSVIDLVMLNEGKGHSVSHYQAHGSGSSNISFGSDHRLLTFHWNIWDTELAVQAKWNQGSSPKVEWTEEMKGDYEQGADKIFADWKSRYPSTPQNKKKAEQMAADLNKRLREALLPLQKPHRSQKGGNNQNPKQLNYDPKIDQLQKKRDQILSEIRENQSELIRSEITRKIGDLQRQILQKAQKTEMARQKKLWDSIISKKTSGQSSDYWQMIKRLRNGSQERFTSMIRSGRNNIVGNKAIANEFANAYQSVYNGHDSDAKTYRNLNSDHESSTVTANTRAEISDTFKTVSRNLNNLADEAQLDSPIDRCELDDAIKAMKKGKALGEDSVPIETISYGGDKVREAVLDVFRALWSSGSTPEPMQKGQVVPVFKGGDSSDTRNFRPITLLNCVFKLYEKVLERRLRVVVQSKGGIPDIQKGALPDTGTNEALFTILSVLKENQTIPATLALLDLSKAYDRVWRKGLWAKLWTFGIKGRLLRAVMSTYSHPGLEVKMGTTTSDKFTMNDGLRQGSVLSPLLFILLFTDMVKNSRATKGLFVTTEEGEEELTSQCFIDDTVLLANSPRDIIQQIDSFNEQAAVWGSILNLHKTKIISNRSLEPISQWMNDNHVTREKGQSHAKYLGVWISVRDNSCQTHYNYAMAKAESTLLRLKSIGVRIGAVTIEEGLELIRRLVIPQLTYAAEVLCPSQSVINKVNTFLLKAVSSVMPLYGNCKPETSLWESGIDDFETMLDKAKLRFHYKLSTTKDGATRYYTSENYLHTTVSGILEKYSLTSFTKDNLKKMAEMEKRSLSKTSWKKKVNEAALNYRVTNLQKTNPALYLTKPFPGLEQWMENIDQTNLLAFFKTRHSAWGPRVCKCDGKSHIDVVGHFFGKCTNEDLAISRMVMLDTMEDELPGFSQLENMEKVYTLLGGPLPLFSSSERGIILWKILLADFMGEAEQNLVCE
jgi:hypothetical protein